MDDRYVRDAVDAAVAEALGSLRGEFADLRQFLDRRLAEVSVDLTHTFEHVDDTETRIARRIAESEDSVRALMTQVVERLSAITDTGAGDTTASSGAELELAVKAAEESADRILSAAERLSAHAAALAAVDHPDAKRAAEAIADEVGVIFEASSFHDLAGQRVRGAIRVLEEVRHAIAASAGLPAPPPRAGSPPPAGMGGAAASQADIDALFG
jgi:chemotaxis protein CheZ